MDAAKLDRWLRKKARGDEDLVQVGWVAVMEAVPDYDASRGCSFETFAFRRAVAHMAIHRRRYRNAVSTPQRGSTYTESETAFGDSLVEAQGSREPSPEDALQRREELEPMLDRLRQLTEREQEMVVEWLKTGDGSAAGRSLGVSRQYVQQALLKMCSPK